MEPDEALRRLHEILDDIRPVAVAVSGGVDSLTLAAIASRHLGTGARMFHAVSAAVPPAATERVHRLAALEHWALTVVEPGELTRPEYVANPVDRCLHCKRALYATVITSTGAQVVSGTNLDDLGDYRPGLRAAREAGVRHPFVEAGVDKAMVRQLARRLGLGKIAELPAAPCLSSRVETGLTITASTLRRIDVAEQFLRASIGSQAIRCRVRRHGLAIEVQADDLSGLDERCKRQLGERINEIFGLGHDQPLPAFLPYRMGSAFLRSVHD
jgi:uncharacterized protein